MEGDSQRDAGAPHSTAVGGAPTSRSPLCSIVLSDPAIDAIIAALPSSCRPRRLALFPDLLRDWLSFKLPIHLLFLPENQKAGRKNLERLETLGRQAARLLVGLQSLEAGTMAVLREVIEREVTGATIKALGKLEPLPPESRFVAAGRYRLVEEWLETFSTAFVGAGRLPKRAPPTSPMPLVVKDLADIFEWVTEIAPRRQVRGEDHPEYGKDYGLFWNFVHASWTQIFGSDTGLSNAVRRWAEAELRIKNSGTVEYPSVLTDIAGRHPEWCLFER